MTTVLVHGVPETAVIWDRLREQLARQDLIALQLPGFGCALPEDFEPTKESYVNWLAAELAQIGSDGSPVDVLGHDWGGGFVVRLVSTRSELVRSWVTDAAGMGSGEFEWHAVAKVWQTPGAGEDFFAGMLAQSPAAVAPAFEAGGIPSADAVEMVSRIDATMAGAILSLYRSAVDVGAEWSADFRAIPVPGLVLAASDDPYTSAHRSHLGAEKAGAKVADLQGLGHWWMLQAPEIVAPILLEFWSNL
jgi:pimeloyl-ACP methyl ester carboxylesterase